MAKDIENKMPKIFDLDQVRKHLGLNITPTSVVLLQELGRFNKLVIRMSRSLAELQRVSVHPWAWHYLTKVGEVVPGPPSVLLRTLHPSHRPWLGKLE